MDKKTIGSYPGKPVLVYIYPEETMKIVLAIILTLSFAALAGTGVLAMNNGDDGLGHARCLASVANGFECPANASPLMVTAFHVSAFQSFSLAVMSAMLLLAAALVVTFWQWRQVSILAVFDRIAYRTTTESSLVCARLRTWLALFEHSPAIF